MSETTTHRIDIPEAPAKVDIEVEQPRGAKSKAAEVVANRTALYALIGTVVVAFLSSTVAVLGLVLPRLATIEHATNSQLTELNRKLEAAVAALDTQGAVITGLEDLIEEIRNPTVAPAPAPPQPAAGTTP